MLTDTKIKSARPSKKRYRIADMDGLYIEITPAGKKYWRFRSNENGKRNWHNLGEYPFVTLQQARELRDGKRHALPVAPKKHEETFSQVASEWVKLHEQKLSNEKEKQNIRSRLNTHILPFIGDRNIAELNTVDILPLMQRLGNIGKYEMSRRVKQIISQVFRYGIMTGYCQNDPTYALRGFLDTPKSRHFASLTRPADVAQLLRSIDAYPQTIVRYAMQFSALTFCRPGEVRHAEWSEIDNEWHIPEGKMKMKRPHIVPLSTQTLSLLDKMRPLTGHGQYVFPSSRA
ncbi:MAG: integrase arm-type DNA-binding domain-containing protein, partial [Synergistaceae bacterium]|nr:integrase arm-type DNA-binding domain-containing protein [Synergistaceae bacterium]